MLNIKKSLNKRHALFSSIWILFLFMKVSGNVWKDVTACYGSDDDCSRYQMECTGGTTIILGKIMYGTKNNGRQDCQYGISNCKLTDTVAACCAYNSSDTFTPFSANNLSAIFENCEGKSACAGWAPRRQTTPFSSYVWMQYACVNERNVTDMCKNNTISGNDLFIRFNMTSNNLLDSVSTSQDCSCRISTPKCNVAMTTTLVDLDFHQPQLEISASNSESSSATCSASSLELFTQNKTYDCQNTQLNTNRHTFERMSEITVQSPDEIVSLKNIGASVLTDGPSYIVLYFKTMPSQPLLVNCFESGITTSITNHCQTTISTQQPSAEASTLSIATSSPSYNSSHNTSLSVSSSSTAELTTMQSPSTEPSIQSSPITFSTRDRETSDSTSSSSQTKTLTTTEFSSTSVSPTFPQTSPFTKQSPTFFPSTERPNRPLSDTRPQNHQPTFSPSSRPDSISTLASTSTAIISSTEEFKPSVTSVDTSNVTDNTSVSPMTSAITSISKAASTSTTANVTGASIDKTTSSESRHGNNTLNYTTTVSVDQNENTNMEPSTAIAGGTTHSSAATTRKTNDDNKNNNGLIIGVTVAVVIVVLIIVAVVMVCLCLRIKRKEKVRRNYIRNTNIFYSFPEDYSEAGNTLSESSPEADRREPSFSNIPRSQLYESVGNPSPSSTLKKATSPLYFDNYKIKAADSDGADVYEKDTHSFSRMPNDNSYVGETSNETIDFVNGVENDDPLKVDSNSNIENGGKSVSFDSSVYYAQVRKEGKTKF
ncbi:mucin-5AC-like [Mercenaria mercenaria]|uniref:mucin-5AC-like n=1 Tax=Mercenaria mercenaria TaxID=6596 RepID=UPI00234FAFE7|nr:mucin-5AC-like [Mercenaria mercenaria]